MRQTNLQRTGILITLLISSFITAMSTTVTGNMIPNIMVFYSVSSSTAQWLTSGATLLSGIIIPITAFLIKRISNKLYYMIAMSFFTVGSFTASLAPNFAVLMVSRLIQALGCGMLLSFAQIIILAIYPKEKQGTMMATYSMAALVSAMVGPTYAGLLMDAVGIKGVFISLFIIGMVLLLMSAVFMCNVTEKQEANINIIYVVLSSFGFLTFIMGLNNMKLGIMHLQSGGLFIMGIILLSVFVYMQLKSDRPMLNLNVFRYSKFCLGIILTVCMYLISMGSSMLLPIYAKIICGYSDIVYGLATIVGASLSACVTLFSGKIYDKLGIKPMAIVTVLSFAAFSIIGIFAKDTASIVYIGIMYALQSVAMASMISPVTTMALSELTSQLRIDGSAIFNTLRQISSSIACTVAILLFTSFGGDLTAFNKVFIYFIIVTAIISVLILLLIISEKSMYENKKY